MKAREKADELLAEIADYTEMLKAVETEAEEELQAVKDKYAVNFNDLKDQIAGANKEILKLMKKNTTEIFEGESRIELDHGSLLFTIEERVKKAHGVLERLEELGFEDALEISKKVKWDELEKWPVEKLIMIGTERKRKELFTYELK
jgi:phage host-nuclease inhibitor protein Gam